MAKIHFDITGDNSNLVSTLNDTTKRLETFSGLMKDLGSAGFDTSTPRAQLRTLAKAIQDNEAVIEDYRKKLQELKTAQREAAMAGDTAKVQELGQQISELGGRMQETISETNELKSAYNELSRSMDKNDGIMVKLLGGQEKYNAILNNLPPVLRNAVTGLNGMTKAAKAFIATPLGAVLAALILAYQALNSWLSTTAEGQQKLARITGYLSGVMSGLRQVANDVGQALYNAFNDPKQAVKDLWQAIKDDIVNRFQSLAGIFANFGKMIGNAFKGDYDAAMEAAEALKASAKSLVLGPDNVGEKIAETIEGIHEIGKAEAELNERRNKLHRERSAWEVKEAELDRQIAEARNKMYSGSTQEREQASAQAQALINAKYAQRIKFAQEEYEIQKASNKLTKSSQENLDKENHLLAQVNREKAAQQSSLAMFTRRGHTAEEANIQAEQRMEDAITALMFQNEEKRIAMIEDEGEREAAAINLKYQKAMAELRKKRREWEELNRKTTGDATLSQEQEDKLAKAEEMAGEELIANTGKNLHNLLEKYKTYEDEKKKLIEKSEKEIAVLEEAGAKEQADKAREILSKRLLEIDKKGNDIYLRLARDTSKWGVVAINKAITDTQGEIERLSQTPELAKQNADAIMYLQKALEGLRKTTKDFSVSGILGMLFKKDESGGKSGAETGSIAERIKALIGNWKALSAEEKWKNVGGWTKDIAGYLGKAANYMSEIAEISGDERLANTAESLKDAAGVLGNIAQGAIQGGAPGAVLAGITSALTLTVQAFANAEKEEAIATRNAKEWKEAIEELAATVNDSKFDTIFGKKAITLAQARMREAIETLALYEKRLNEYKPEVEDKWRSVSRGINTGAIVTYTQQYQTYLDAVEKGYQGLQTMLVLTKKQTGWAKFWGAQDQYTALGDLYPELWDENGDLVIESAEKLLSVNSQLTDEQKAQISNLVELKQAYDEATKAVDEQISSVFGSLSSDITDIIWDSVMNGADAWGQFEQVGSEAIANLGKQLIQEMLISTYLEDFRDDMRAAFRKDDPAETQTELRSIIGEIWGGMEQMLASGTAIAEEYQRWAEAHGFDLTGSESSRNASAKGFQTMSDETASELNGRFTALQISGGIIAQSAQAGLAEIINIGNLVGETNGVLGEIRALHVLEMGFLEDIAKQTKPILDFVDVLNRIKTNTDKL